MQHTIDFLHRRWRYKPDTRPTEQTYVVAVYAIAFEEQWGSRFLPGGPVHLYREMTSLGCYVDTRPVNKRLVPSAATPGVFPARQVFATSIPVGPERPIRTGGSGERTPIASGGDVRTRRPIRSGGS